MADQPWETPETKRVREMNQLQSEGGTTTVTGVETYEDSDEEVIITHYTTETAGTPGRMEAEYETTEWETTRTTEVSGSAHAYEYGTEAEVTRNTQNAGATRSSAEMMAEMTSGSGKRADQSWATPEMVRCREMKDLQSERVYKERAKEKMKSYVSVPDSPEIVRLRQQQNMSEVKYHQAYEKSKAKGYTSVVDTPENIRVKESGKIVSQVGQKTSPLSAVVSPVLSLTSHHILA
ncbi:nebulette-like isoform X1 [Branchiostoma lanceolatum]|uniref:nebulette-like isoform X1 n=1 Tax=Branchiostoma lanceolatum TaxID=7740 RepID=UPI0034557925